MPELPEVETIRRELDLSIKGLFVDKVVVNRYDLRKPVPSDLSETIKGKRVRDISRRGKYLVFLLESGNKINDLMIVHLGMSGRIRIYSGGNKEGGRNTYKPRKHDHAVFYMKDGTCVAYEDPRRFGMITLMFADNWETLEPFSKMGPEPLDNWSGADLLDKIKNKKIPIKTALLDQRVVAGLGNIYVCEALYMSGVSPFRKCCEISLREANKIASNVRVVLEKAIKAGGSTLKDYQKTDGSLGYFQHQFLVYDREKEKCPDEKCGGVIQRAVQSGRSTFYCPDCQK